MKVAIVDSNHDYKIKKIVSKYFKIVKDDPDFVISVGGDGTVLLSERLYPSIPKLTIKTSNTCRKCQYMPSQLKHCLELIKNGKYEMEEESKIEAKFKGKKILALNEIQIHNKKPTVAIRFSVKSTNFFQNNVIGDGLVISTPFGSTGYYMSITGKTFKKGLGLAFNNTHNLKIKNVVLNEKSKINVKLLREDAWLLRDNDEKYFNLKEGDKFIAYKSSQRAMFIKF
ncbi:MAG: hypothetical protein QXF88_02710 [Candidatus Aenigmatarchaeota archaeon]